MTKEEFEIEAKKLQTRFGVKAMDMAFLELLFRETSDLPIIRIVKIIDHFVGLRPHNKPPTLQDFREMILKDLNDIRKEKDREYLRNRESGGLDKALKMLGAASLEEALEIAILKHKIKEADEAK